MSTQRKMTWDELAEENERLRGELKDYTQNGLWREWRQRALDSEATLDICAEEKAALRADRDRLHRIEEAMKQIAAGGYQGRGDNSLSPGGVRRFTYTKKGLRAIARAALADQPTEEKLTPSQELMYAEDGYDPPTEEEV